MFSIWLLAAYCFLLLLAAACCCLPAAYLLLLTCCSPRLVALGSPPRGDTQGKQKTSIAFLPSRILARSVSFRCQVSTPSQVFDLHFLGNAQIIPSTAPDAMFMSWCPTGPKSTYLLSPRPHNGTGCYVNESVPELIYAFLNFMGVDGC